MKFAENKVESHKRVSDVEDICLGLESLLIEHADERRTSEEWRVKKEEL